MSMTYPFLNVYNRLLTFINVYVTASPEKCCKLLSVGEGDLSPMVPIFFFEARFNGMPINGH
jgi:hypothetical protein